jgi:hypothetical protein
MQKVDQQTQAQLNSFSTETGGYTLIVPKNEFNDTAAGGAPKSVFSHFGINSTELSSENATKVRTSISLLPVSSNGRAAINQLLKQVLTWHLDTLQSVRSMTSTDKWTNVRLLSGTVGPVNIRTPASDVWGKQIRQTWACIPKKYAKRANI